MAVLHRFYCYSSSFSYFQPFLGIGEISNKITGKIKMGSDTLANIDGHWDQDIFIKDKATGVSIIYDCLWLELIRGWRLSNMKITFHYHSLKREGGVTYATALPSIIYRSIFCIAFNSYTISDGCIMEICLFGLVVRVLNLYW